MSLILTVGFVSQTTWGWADVPVKPPFVSFPLDLVCPGPSQSPGCGSTVQSQLSPSSCNSASQNAVPSSSEIEAQNQLNVEQEKTGNPKSQPVNDKSADSKKTKDKSAATAPVDPNNPDVPCVTTGTQIRLRLPRQRTRYSLNQIYEFDHEPLGNRIPVILLPGRAEEFQQNSWWRAVNHHTRRDPVYRHRFKTYLFLYNSKDELDVQARDLTKELKQNFAHLPRTQPLMLVTYSLGGLIAREVLADTAILNQVDTMIAIGVPFHGSPMFDPQWFNDYLNPPNRFFVRRFWDRLIYRAYMMGKNNLQRGMKWDNFDGSKPEFILPPSQDKPNGEEPVVTQGPLSPDYPNGEAIRQKMVVYASFLENGYTQTSQPPNPMRLPRYASNEDRGLNLKQRKAAWLDIPGKVLVSILPVYGFTVHSVFTYMNFQLANVSTYIPGRKKLRNTHLYRFNDGAIPMTSQLFLPPRPYPYKESLKELTPLIHARKARIFSNLDHVHLGEYSLRKSVLHREDMLHPEEGVYRPNQWILMDLRNRLDFVPQTNTVTTN